MPDGTASLAFPAPVTLCTSSTTGRYRGSLHPYLTDVRSSPTSIIETEVFQEVTSWSQASRMIETPSVVTVRVARRKRKVVVPERSCGSPVTGHLVSEGG